MPHGDIVGSRTCRVLSAKPKHSFRPSNVKIPSNCGSFFHRHMAEEAASLPPLRMWWVKPIQDPFRQDSASPIQINAARPCCNKTTWPHAGIGLSPCLVQYQGGFLVCKCPGTVVETCTIARQVSQAFLQALCKSARVTETGTATGIHILTNPPCKRMKPEPLLCVAPAPTPRHRFVPAPDGCMRMPKLEPRPLPTSSGPVQTREPWTVVAIGTLPGRNLFRTCADA